ncbi:MAG: hypothetical protein HC899_27030 [Leptolyngbyaceae cyanobacterium SM1_4_3]|nr:hypothetical protein [Leptolyngbyaceae cyanobacterium SM1_4_3]
MPTGMNPLPQFIQPHLTIDDFTKQTVPLIGTNGDEIQSCGGVIISFQPNRSPMMFVRVIFHGIYQFI